jgi:hypothetical protein
MTVKVTSPLAFVVEERDTLFTEEVTAEPSNEYDSVVVAFAATNAAS